MAACPPCKKRSRCNEARRPSARGVFEAEQAGRNDAPEPGPSRAPRAGRHNAVQTTVSTPAQSQPAPGDEQEPPRRRRKQARDQSAPAPARPKKARRGQRKPAACKESTAAQQVQTTVVDDPLYKGHIARVVSAYDSAQDPPTARKYPYRGQDTHRSDNISDAPVAGPSNLGLHIQDNNNYLAHSSGKRVHSTGTRVNDRMQLWDGPERARATSEKGEKLSVNEARPVGHDLFCNTCHRAGRVVYWQDRDKALKHVRLQHREGRPQRHEEERGKGSGTKRKKQPQPPRDEDTNNGQGRDSNKE